MRDWQVSLKIWGGIASFDISPVTEKEDELQEQKC
jgi:hypothetical protein